MKALNQAWYTGPPSRSLRQLSDAWNGAKGATRATEFSRVVIISRADFDRAEDTLRGYCVPCLKLSYKGTTLKSKNIRRKRGANRKRTKEEIHNCVLNRFAPRIIRHVDLATRSYETRNVSKSVKFVFLLISVNNLVFVRCRYIWNNSFLLKSAYLRLYTYYFIIII